jgi:alpha-amylase/alpha-mannosidase (GH57 family)
LLAKEEGFTEEDKHALLDAQQRLAAKVVPLWRALSERGQVELSTTPYFHPILPLVHDSDSARRCMPEAVLPPRFSHPDDAREQVQRALARHEATFGARPTGMWPAEGSVSPEVLALLAAEGVRWAATDEGIRHRSQPPLPRHGALFQPHRFETADGGLHLFFRDRTLSDRVGFAYTSMPAAEAVADFLAHARRVEQEATEAGVARPLLAVVLDGENAWEHYEDHGRPFLDALHDALSREEGIACVTLSQALDADAPRLETVHTGSWIDANFRIWIGHPEDNLAWTLLGEVRAGFDDRVKAGLVSQERASEARTHLLAAEASDWFWWYGDDFTTDNAAEFDRLFRDRLLRACALADLPAPPRLFRPISRQALGQRGEETAVTMPTARLSPPLDDRPPGFFDWLGAGRLTPASDRGSMHRASGGVRRIDFGFGEEDVLFLRLLSDEELPGTRLVLSLGERTMSVDLHEPGPLVGPDGLRGYVSHRRVVLAVRRHACPEEAFGASFTLRRGDTQLARLPTSGTLRLSWPGPHDLRWRG